MSQNRTKGPYLSRSEMLQHGGLFLAISFLFALFLILTGSGSSEFGPTYDFFLRGLLFATSTCFLSLAGLTVELGGNPTKERFIWFFMLMGAGALVWLIFCVTELDKIVRG